MTWRTRSTSPRSWRPAGRARGARAADRAPRHGEQGRLDRACARTPGGDLSRVKLVWFVPADALDVTREAVFSAGGGRIGAYERCSWYTPGTGTFLGGEASDPTIGERGREEHVPELRVETVVPADRIAAAVGALRSVHPYEEPAYDVYPLADA